MISILIPYTTRNPRWEHNELRYCLRSLEKNCDFEYDVTLFTDAKVDWLQNVNQVIVDRYYPPGLAERLFNGTKHFEQFYDVLNKLKLASLREDLQEEILWVYDDVLLLKKQSYDQIKMIYAGDSVERRKDYWLNPQGNKWKRTIFKALQIARGYGEMYLYETHLPRYYTKTNLKKMFSLYPVEAQEVPYAPSTTYFNMFYDKPDYVYRDPRIDDQQDNPIKAGFYGDSGTLCDAFSSRSRDDVEKAVQNKIWVNYNEAGMSEHLTDWIIKTFPKKSKYEK